MIPSNTSSGRRLMSCLQPVLLIDNHSTHGTFVNNVKLTANEAHALRSGDRVKFGQSVSTGCCMICTRQSSAKGTCSYRPATYSARAYRVEYDAWNFPAETRNTTSNRQSSRPVTSGSKGFTVPVDSDSDVSLELVSAKPRSQANNDVTFVSESRPQPLWSLHTKTAAQQAPSPRAPSPELIVSSPARARGCENTSKQACVASDMIDLTSDEEGPEELPTGPKAASQGAAPCDIYYKAMQKSCHPVSINQEHTQDKAEAKMQSLLGFKAAEDAAAGSGLHENTCDSTDSESEDSSMLSSTSVTKPFTNLSVPDISLSESENEAGSDESDHNPDMDQSHSHGNEITPKAFDETSSESASDTNSVNEGADARKTSEYDAGVPDMPHQGATIGPTASLQRMPSSSNRPSAPLQQLQPPPAPRPAHLQRPPWYESLNEHMMPSSAPEISYMPRLPNGRYSPQVSMYNDGPFCAPPKTAEAEDAARNPFESQAPPWVLEERERMSQAAKNAASAGLDNLRLFTAEDSNADPTAARKSINGPLPARKAYAAEPYRPRPNGVSIAEIVNGPTETAEKMAAPKPAAEEVGSNPASGDRQPSLSSVKFHGNFTAANRIRPGRRKSSLPVFTSGRVDSPSSGQCFREVPIGGPKEQSSAKNNDDVSPQSRDVPTPTTFDKLNEIQSTFKDRAKSPEAGSGSSNKGEHSTSTSPAIGCVAPEMGPLERQNKIVKDLTDMMHPQGPGSKVTKPRPDIIQAWREYQARQGLGNSNIPAKPKPATSANAAGPPGRTFPPPTHGNLLNDLLHKTSQLKRPAPTEPAPTEPASSAPAAPGPSSSAAGAASAGLEPSNKISEPLRKKARVEPRDRLAAASRRIEVLRHALMAQPTRPSPAAQRPLRERVLERRRQGTAMERAKTFLSGCLFGAVTCGIAAAALLATVPESLVQEAARQF